MFCEILLFFFFLEIDVIFCLVFELFLSLVLFLILLFVLLEFIVFLNDLFWWKFIIVILEFWDLVDDIFCELCLKIKFGGRLLYLDRDDNVLYLCRKWNFLLSLEKVVFLVFELLCCFKYWLIKGGFFFLFIKFLLNIKL